LITEVKRKQRYGHSTFMSGAPLLPSAGPPKALKDVPTAAVAPNAQTLAGQQIATNQRLLREAANAAAVARVSSATQSISTRSSAASLSQAYSQVWTAVTRNVRQVAVKSSEPNQVETADADGVDESPECSDDDAADEGTETGHTHGHKHGQEKRGLEKRGPQERNLIKQNAPQPKPKQNQQHHQKRKRREENSFDLDTEDDACKRIDPWASAGFKDMDAVSGHRSLGYSIDFEGLEPVQRVASAKKVESLSEASPILRETGLPQREYNNELIWLLGIMAFLLLVLGLIYGLGGHGEQPPEPAKTSNSATQQQETQQQPTVKK
jgi:hypothetical protein